MQAQRAALERKGKERKNIYIAPFMYYNFLYISKRSGMDHTVLPANTPCLPFLCKRSSDGATISRGKRYLIAAYYSSIDPEEGGKGATDPVPLPLPPVAPQAKCLFW